MSIVSLKPVKGSAKSAHQQVEINDQVVGEVWREKTNVIVSKLKQPLRQQLKWRWFAKAEGDTRVLGRQRVSFAGLGFPTKDKAIDEIEAVRAAAGSVTP